MKCNYYEIAKAKCADNGGRLPNLAELQYLAEQGKLNGWYWSSEEKAPDTVYQWRMRNSSDVGGASDSQKSYDQAYRNVLCIGNY